MHLRIVRTFSVKFFPNSNIGQNSCHYCLYVYIQLYIQVGVGQGGQMQQRSKPLTNASISLKWLETERPCLLWCHALNIIKYHSLSYYLSTNAMFVLVLVLVLVPWELTNVEARHLNRPFVMSVSQIVSVRLFKPVSCHKATSYYAGPLCLSPVCLMALDKGIRPTSLTTSETVCLQSVHIWPLFLT